MGTTISTDLIRGHTDTIILNVLSQGDNYGYGIYKRIIELSGNQYELKEATLTLLSGGWRGKLNCVLLGRRDSGRKAQVLPNYRQR